MYGNKKGFTLLELILAVVLLAFLIGAATVYSKYIGLMYTDVNQKAIISTAKLGSGLEYIVQRVLHSNEQKVTDGGNAVEFDVIYGGSKRNAKIFYDPAANQVLYDYNIADDKPAKVFLMDVENLRFKKEAIASGENRLSIEIQASHEPYPIKLRTSLIGRNRPIPQGKIN